MEGNTFKIILCMILITHLHLLLRLYALLKYKINPKRTYMSTILKIFCLNKYKH